MQPPERSPFSLPPPLRAGGSSPFIDHTISVRLPDIARRVLSENDFPTAINARLEELIREVPDKPLRPLRDREAPDAADWDRYLASCPGQNWLQVPWFFAETYFFRRILEATGHFQPGAGQDVDPYSRQKRLGLETSRPAIQALSRNLNIRLRGRGWSQESFQELLHVDLWGNQMDLSLWPVGGEGRPDHTEAGQRRDHTLVDDAQVVGDFVASWPAAAPRLDFVIDNAGFELVDDFCLADYLLSTGKVTRVVFHLKTHPTYVSDATHADLKETVVWLSADPDRDVQKLATRLHQHLGAGRLEPVQDLFWTSPLSGWEMPLHLHETLAATGLVISKGDANYRRLLGDRQWPFTTSFAEVVGYFPAPLVALRTLKSELAVGLVPGQPESLAQKDTDWLTDGRWGMIQFYNPATGRG